MKLLEISNSLSSEEVDQLLLNEDFEKDIAKDLEKIIADNVKKPFEVFCDQSFKKFVQRLKSWSLPLIYDLEKDPDTKNAGYMKTLKKIASDPTASAKSIFNRIVAKQLEEHPKA